MMPKFHYEFNRCGIASSQSMFTIDIDKVTCKFCKLKNRLSPNFNEKTVSEFVNFLIAFGNETRLKIGLLLLKED